ncbi:MAG: long-chain-fatty-acid--CoA ligase [Solirubrobacteraceae bacterium]
MDSRSTIKQTTGGVGLALARAASLFGGRTAVVDGDRRVSYAELAGRVAGLGGGLRDLGVQAGDVVAVLAQNSLEHLECWLGIPQCGCVLNDLNYRLADAELEFVLDDAATVALIVDDAFAERGASLAEKCESVRHLIYYGAGESPAGAVGYDDLIAAEAAPDIGAGEQLAGIFYTGGTTGLPKGVMLTHNNMLANAKHVLISFRYREDDCYLHAGPMFHLADGGSTYSITWIGATHVIVPAFEPELVARAIAAEGVTVCVFVPTMINMLVNSQAALAHDLSSVRQVVYGGAPMASELQRKAAAAIDCEWVQGYGMTESASLVSLCRLDHRRALGGEEPEATRIGSAGTPVVGVEVEVRRPDGSRADVGEPGEICVRGPNMLAGYWQRPEETAAVLDTGGWYHSGDAAYVDADGYLYVVDRIKDMIISGGENVYSTEVENAIYTHSAVFEVAVFAIPDLAEKWGERVHAIVVLKPGAQLEEGELIAHCRERIAGYKLPRSVEFRTEPLPKSGAGKLLKRELREPYWAGLERRVS